MEELDNIAQPANRMCLKTIRILRTPDAAAEKEFIGEFFQFIGCLVHDVPITVSKREPLPEEWGAAFERALGEQTRHDVDLILTRIPNAPWSSDVVNQAHLLFPERRVVVVYLNFKRKAFQIGDIASPPRTKLSRLTQDVLSALIDQIWCRTEEDHDRCSLQTVNQLFCTQELFHYLQLKRTFRTVNTKEVLALGTDHYYIPYKPYIARMVTAFDAFRHGLLPDSLQSVYAVYACTNAARKIREIYAVLPPDSEFRKRQQPPTVPARKLLEELNAAYQLDEHYSGIYYLAAYICQDDPELKLSAYDYYKKASAQSEKETDGFYAFGIYQLGRFVKKNLNETDYALRCYQNAQEKNPRCYQAVFQLACCYAERGLYSQALFQFVRVIQILSDGLELKDLPQDLPCWDPTDLHVFYASGFGDWEFLSLKEIQYLYKSYIWIINISKKLTGEEGIGPFVQKALSAAIAYRYAPILHSCCESDTWDIISNFHAQGLPTRALFIVLQNVIGVAPPNLPLREQINADIASL